MSLGKAMIHARKQKAIAKAAVLAGDTRPDSTRSVHSHSADAGAGAERLL